VVFSMCLHKNSNVTYLQPFVWTYILIYLKNDHPIPRGKLSNDPQAPGRDAESRYMSTPARVWLSTTFFLRSISCFRWFAGLLSPTCWSAKLEIFSFTASGPFPAQFAWAMSTSRYCIRYLVILITLCLPTYICTNVVAHLHYLSKM
jgi:hypothetical protein